MHLKALKVYCDVARCRSFSQAAQGNGVSQSAVSQIISQIERELKTQLIDRSVRPLQLTTLGQAYYDGCRTLLDQYTELESRIRNEHSQLAANAVVAAIYSVGLGDMEEYVQRFYAQHPNAQVHIDYLHPDKVYERVSAGTSDFGLVSFPRKSRDLIITPWRDEEMVLVCAPSHRLARRSHIRPEDLNGEKYIGFTRELVIRRYVDRFLREHGIYVEVAREFDNIENIKKAIEVAAGVALLPEPTLGRDVSAGTLVAIPLSGCRFVRPLGIIQRRHHRLSSTATRFLALLREPKPPRAAWNGTGTRLTNGSNAAPKR
jgi:DNA-binding transcriptional LysR family regulator